MNKKTKKSYIEEVGHTLFRDFMRMPREQRKTELEYVADTERPLKYLYAMALMDIFMMAYVWGFISHDEVQELQSVKKMMEYENFDDALNTVDVDALDDEQHGLYLEIVEAINKGTIDFDLPSQLERLGFPEEVVNKCDLSCDEVFQELMMNERYHVDADGQYNDMYTDIMRRFKPEYLKKLKEFKELINLMSDGYFDMSEIDLSNEATIPTFEKRSDESQIAHELDIVSGICGYLENRGLVSPEMSKSIFYWGKVSKGYFLKLVREMRDLPEHQQFPEIKKRLKSVSEAFETLFPNAKEQDLEICRDLLINHVREALKENIQKGNCTPKALEWFDKHIKTNQGVKEFSGQQKIYDDEADKYIAERMYLIKEALTKLKPELEQFDIMPDREPSESVAQEDHRDVPLSEQTELQKAMTELDVLKNKYLSDDERDQIGGKRAVFSFMLDYELLYIMGVFNQEEYYSCKAYQDEAVQQGDAIAIRECTVVDIFNKLLEQPDSRLLPIKKEYLAAMEQVRLASLLYQDIYTDNSVDKMCLLFDSPFENDYMAADTKLRQEGLFLEDMVLLTRHLEGTKRKNNYIVQLVNSYWEESISQLAELPEYKGRPEVVKQIRDNMMLFESDSNMDKKNRKKYNFKTRRLLYQRLLSQLHYEICEKYAFDLNKRARALNTYARYLEPFEKRLKITMDEQLKLYFGKTALKGVHDRQ